ncbi:hypothetical protein BJX63DRAFT_384912, partial [Aspergillus granulosus]
MPPRLKPVSLLRLQRAPLSRAIRGSPSASISLRTAQISRPKITLTTKSDASLNSNICTRSAIRSFSSTPTSASPASRSGRSQADLIVEELQELYETATDELEIATESTDSSTIYAASDRESARDALNSLIAAFELYTSGVVPEVAESDGTEGDEETGRLVELAIDPADVPESVREEVRKRVGQRVREVKSAVENLEARAH